MENKTDANVQQESSPVVDVQASESSPDGLEQEVQEVNEKNVPFNEHPRFQELIQEKNELKEEIRKLQNHLLETSKPRQEVVKEDMYEGLEPEVKEWYKKDEKRVEAIAKRIAEEERRKAESELQALRQEYGKLAAKEFLKEHPDLQRGSKELEEIVQKAQQIGGDLEGAYKIVMFDRHAQRVADDEKKRAQKRIQEKVAANVEVKTTPKAVLPVDKKLSFNEMFDSAWKENAPE